MKKFLIVVLCILLIGAVIFCVNSCQKNEKPEVITPDPNGIIELTPDDGPGSEEQESQNGPKHDESTVYTGTGIYHGKIDSTFIEVTIDSIHPILEACRLSPELAEKFSSLNLEPETIITFEYRIIDDQYVISKIN